MSLQHGLLTHGNPVTSRERRAVEPHSPTHDLHRSIALVIQVMGKLRASLQRSQVEPDISTEPCEEPCAVQLQRALSRPVLSDHASVLGYVCSQVSSWAASSSRMTRFKRPRCKATRIASMRRLNVWPQASVSRWYCSTPSLL